MEILLVFVVGIVIAVLVGAAIRSFKSSSSADPEEPTPPGRESTTGTADGEPNIPSYPGEDRPGGPGAESMNAPEAGQPSPSDSPGDGGGPDAVAPSEAGRKELGDQ
jgi:hypothetical protein